MSHVLISIIVKMCIK